MVITVILHNLSAFSHDSAPLIQTKTLFETQQIDQSQPLLISSQQTDCVYAYACVCVYTCVCPCLLLHGEARTVAKVCSCKQHQVITTKYTYVHACMCACMCVPVSTPRYRGLDCYLQICSIFSMILYRILATRKGILFHLQNYRICHIQ